MCKNMWDSTARKSKNVPKKGWETLKFSSNHSREEKEHNWRNCVTWKQAWKWNLNSKRFMRGEGEDAHERWRRNQVWARNTLEWQCRSDPWGRQAGRGQDWAAHPTGTGNRRLLSRHSLPKWPGARIPDTCPDIGWGLPRKFAALAHSWGGDISLWFWFSFPGWLVMLSTFSCTCWTSVCLPQRSVVIKKPARFCENVGKREL